MDFPVLRGFGLSRYNEESGEAWLEGHTADSKERQLGRIVSVHYGGLFVRTEDAVLLTTPSAKIRRLGRQEADGKPAVGDWVVVRPAANSGAAFLLEILPRRSSLVRRAAGGDDMPQIVAANVDVVMICMALGVNYNIRRLERYLALAAHGGSRACVVLTKCDEHADGAERELEVRAVAGESAIFVVSALAGVGLDALRSELRPGITAVMVGSSGVGKSTLLNALAGEHHMLAKAVREKDDKGRHTTTHRELFRLPSGALLIDTPGLREVGIVGEQDVSSRRKRRGNAGTSVAKKRHT